MNEITKQCTEYIVAVDMLNEPLHPSAIGLARYVLQSWRALPLKTIIVVERPYATKIHGSVSSAMSFDSNKSSLTPSVRGLAADLWGVDGLSMVEVAAWFRESWKYASSGVLLFNVMHKVQFTSPDSLSEIIPFQKFLRSLIIASSLMSKDKIAIISMGGPAQSVISGLMQNLGEYRLSVTKLTYPNPAIISNMKGDIMSQDFTLGRPGTTKSIARAIRRSYNYTPLNLEHYTDISIMSDQMIRVTDAVIEQSTSLGDALESAYAKLQMTAEGPTIKQSLDAFKKSMVAFRDQVVIEVVRHAAATREVQSQFTGKGTKWGEKSPYKKIAPSIGESTNTGIVASSNGGEEVMEPMIIPEEPDVTPIAAPKVIEPVAKKRVVRRVRKVKHQSPLPDVPSARVNVPDIMEATDNRCENARMISYYLTEHGSDPKGIVYAAEMLTESGSTDNRHLIIALSYCEKIAASDFKTAGDMLGFTDGTKDDTLIKLISGAWNMDEDK